MSPSPALQCNGVSKIFDAHSRNPVHAVANLDLRIDTGEIVAFLGPNGAGKTTTIDMVLGLSDPTAGSVQVLGSNPRHAIDHGQVGAVLQTGGLLGDLSVAETITLVAGLFPHHLPVGEVIERAGLTSLAKRRVSKCSGGEQQRLRFALALLPGPQLLILDEPTAGMDVAARRDFWSAMRQEATEGRTIVFATHYLEEASDIAERIVVIAHGRLVADGQTEEIRASVSGRTVSVDTPAPAELAASVRAWDGVGAVTVTGTRVEAQVSSGQSDQVARQLLANPQVKDLEITSASLEAAFLSITEGNPS